MKEPTLYVSPEGNDAWTGTSPTRSTSASGLTEGPLFSPRFAIMVAREWRRRGQAGPNVRIQLAAGHYPLTFPIELGPEDNGLHLAGEPGGKVVFDGSIPLAGGRQVGSDTTFWEFDVSDHLLHEGAFSSLFVNGKRRHASRFPTDTHLNVVEAPLRYDELPSSNLNLLAGVKRLRIDPDQVKSLGDITGARLIVLNRWIIERIRVQEWHPETGDIILERFTRFIPKPEPELEVSGCRFYIEDHGGFPKAMGTWTLDRAAGVLRYWPETGEILEQSEILISLTKQFVRVSGNLDEQVLARNLVIENIRFHHADWVEPDNRFYWWDPYQPGLGKWRESCRSFIDQNAGNPREDTGAVPQAAFNCPGAIHFEYAEDCEVHHCEIAHVGFHAVGVGLGCKNLYIRYNHLWDLGAGGIIAEGTNCEGPAYDRTGYLHINDNEIAGTGNVFPAACGITLIHAARCTLTHNKIHDLSYTGISVGWMWGSGENPSYGHLIEKNYIHDVGVRGGLSDMGAIYLLGFQPGTYVRHNHIRNVNRAAYGGWGIYPDEGSSGLTVEGNLIEHCASNCIHQHQGRQNIFRNNVLAYSGSAAFRLKRDQRTVFSFPPQGTFLSQNIFITRGQPMIHDMLGATADADLFRSNLNILYDELAADGDPVLFQVSTFEDDAESKLQHINFRLSESKAAHLEAHSLTCPPGFRDPSNGDFSLREDAPALSLGFQPLQVTDVGPRETTGPSRR